MPNIGTLGDIVFQTSSRAVETIRDYKRSGSGRWATHDIISQKPVLEFLGPGLEELSFVLYLNASVRAKPSERLKRLREMRDNGEVVNFILDGAPVSENKFVVEKLDETTKIFNRGGGIAVAEVSVSLKEYVVGEEEKNERDRSSGNAPEGN